MKTLRLGTRGSQLALWQANHVKRIVESHSYSEPVAVELVILKTKGDVTDGPLTQMGGQGVFTKRLQDALLQNEIDLAVHSLKDLPTQPVPGLQLTAVPKRADARDALLSTSIGSFAELSSGARVGTGSNRRKAQLLFHRADLEIADIRGNLDTRLQKLKDGEYDAIVLAKAGLERLGWTDLVVEVFQPEMIVPAVGQGALGIETRSPATPEDQWIVDCLEPIQDKTSRLTVTAERAMLRSLQAGCTAPVGSWARMEDDQLVLTGVVLSTDGSQRLEVELARDPSEATILGQEAAEFLLEQGAATWIPTTSHE